MSFSTPSVSVIVPCLNAERTLGEALESVLKQTVPPLEILVIDDGSTDNSLKVAHEFGPRVRLLHNVGKGPGAARHVGVRHAHGTYIAFVDADDTVLPHKHAQQLDVMTRHGPFALVHTGAELFWDDNSRPPTLRSSGEEAVGHCTRAVFERNPVCGASSMLSRSVILNLGNYDPDLFGTEDYGMSLAASTCCTFFHLPEPLYRMRRHGGNVSGRKAHMAYYHWLAQERFRHAFPHAFAQLPAESVAQYMIEPVVQAAVEAYWKREPRGYRKLLKLAHALAADDPRLTALWRRRLAPMGMLRWWDRLRTGRSKAMAEVSP